MIGIESGNTAWVLIAAAMVFFMTPGLALFYGGMARSKNVLSTIMQSFFLIGVISVEFMLIGYTLIFGDDVHGIIGSLNKIGLMGTENSIMEGANIPEMAFIAFQCMFAIITPAIMSGSITGRMRFAPFVVFAVIWSVLIYNPMAHWVWGGGFLANLGASTLAANAVLTTQMSAAIGIVGWVLVERYHRGKPTVLGAVSGGVSGLVAITPAAGFVTPVAAIPIGFIGAICCYVAVAVLKSKFGYDDSLDAFGIHGVGGMWGAIATGLFATVSVNPDGADGLFYGGNLLIPQLISLVVAIALAIIGTTIIFKVVSLFMDMRVSISAESLGIDISEHGEGAYNQSEFKSSGRFITSDQHSLV